MCSLLGILSLNPLLNPQRAVARSEPVGDGENLGIGIKTEKVEWAQILSSSPTDTNGPNLSCARGLGVAAVL